jgi:uncharacterized protein YgbK (DUF1537 family)
MENQFGRGTPSSEFNRNENNAKLFSMKLLVIADDLSGATDVGVQFARRGFSALVYPWASMKARIENPASQQEHPVSAQILLIDTESRHLPAVDSAARVRAVVEHFKTWNIDSWFKKTDSTLRGNIGAELESFIMATGANVIPFIPAHPLLGRQTRGGLHLVNGDLLENSSFASDPRDPIRESDLKKIISTQTRIPIEVTSASHFRHNNQERGIVVFNIEDLTELSETARLLAEQNLLTFAAGSAGFADCVASQLQFTRQEQSIPKVKPPLVVISGSLNPVTFEQCQIAVQNGFKYIRMEATELFEDSASQVGEVLYQLKRGENIIISTAISDEEVSKFHLDSQHYKNAFSDLSEAVAASTGSFTRRLFSELSQSGLNTPEECISVVIIGGDTLGAITAANSWPALIPLDEVIPGAALCRIQGESGILLVTKPGGFGKPDLLVQLAQPHEA